MKQRLLLSTVVCLTAAGLAFMVGGAGSARAAQPVHHPASLEVADAWPSGPGLDSRLATLRLNAVRQLPRFNPFGPFASAAAVAPTGSAVLNGVVSDASSGVPLEGAKVRWAVPYDGGVTGGLATTAVDGSYSLAAVPSATGNGVLVCDYAGWGDAHTLRSGLSWPDATTTTFDFPRASAWLSITRGGPWGDWTHVAAVIGGRDATSAVYADFATHTNAWGDVTTSVSCLPGTYDAGAVYFWSQEGVEIPTPLLAAPTANEMRDVAFADGLHGWAVGSTTFYHDLTFDKGAILSTTDGGNVWTRQAPAFEPSGFVKVGAFDALNAWIIDEFGACYMTSDGGSHWQVTGGGHDYPLGADFLDASHGWTVGWGGSDIGSFVCRTTDGGAYWTTVTGQSERPLYGVDFVDAAHGWAVGDEGAIVRTTDGGATWDSQISPATSALRAIEFVTPERGCAVGDQTVITTDGGQTWSLGGSIYTAHDVDFTDSLNGVAATSTSLMRTTDGGVTWAFVPGTGAGAAPLYGCAGAGNSAFWVVGDGARLSGSTDGGQTWASGSAQVSELDAQRFGIVSPASGSGRPGSKVKLLLQHVPNGWPVVISGYPAWPLTAPVKQLATLTSNGNEDQPRTVTIPSTVKPGYFYFFGFEHQGGPLYLETAFQLSTLKPSRTAIASGGSVTLSGVVPTQNHFGSTPGKKKYVYLFKSTRSATRGFKFVRRYQTNGYGVFRTGRQSPSRTTWYVVVYAKDGVYWEAPTPTVKVTVR